jgi:hypothetical protein
MENNFSNWEKYKKISNSWDLINKNKYASENSQKERLALCSLCPEFIKTSKQCKQCNCFIEEKAKLNSFSCPLGRWGKNIDN